MENTVELLKELTQTVGVSGSEEHIVKLLKAKLAPYGEVTVDAMNNVLCTFGEGYHFLLDAHLDEIGLIVKEITDDGFIKFDKCGGIDARPLPALEVTVWGKEKIDGVISTLPPHLQSADDEKKVPEISDLSIDTGFSKSQLEKMISLGDRITFKRNFTPLLNGMLSASCLDDRAGVVAILLALDKLKQLSCKITVMFSSQEEVGKRGAKAGAFSINADEAIAVDVSFADSPGCDKSDCGEIANGPMIGFSPILDKEMSKNLTASAEKYGIPYQHEIMSGITGTDADVMAVSACGLKTALISIPEKYMHQRVEVVNISDIENVSRLICAYIKERLGDLNA